VSLHCPQTAQLTKKTPAIYKAIAENLMVIKPSITCTQQGRDIYQNFSITFLKVEILKLFLGECPPPTPFPPRASLEFEPTQTHLTPATIFMRIT